MESSHKALSINNFDSRASMQEEHDYNGLVEKSVPLEALKVEEKGDRPRWRSLFAFMHRAHHLPLFIALALSVMSGILIPVLAYILGKIFDSFTDYGGGKISSTTFTSTVTTNALYLVILGSVSWVLNGHYFMFWLFFGELQAKSARDKMYEGMLHKPMSWYDTRKVGINAMIPRFQT